ncbi:unnamed protein product [Mytilus edulis]|uniref:Uncharacterized protein n=1 Tax=Mytilus edulis TaxID=6550 RepID=A0A8S3Q514_MYTED|nr:unnamed protein product [Mytilus edulis]
MEYLRLEENDDYIDLFREFQTKKHSIRSYQQNKVVINLPVSLIELVRQKHRRFERAIEQSPYKETVMFSKLKLHISPDTFRGLFEPSIRAIIKHFAEMQKNPKVEDINILGLVGGFVECELVHNAVSSYFGNSKSILVPEDARTAVMKGAVLYAFQPKAKTDLLLSKISKMHGNDFKDLISKGDFASYENRVYLAGACNIGKSSLASILIGEVVPTKWHSTDGLVIHFGRNGIHLEDKKMIPLGQSDTNILKKLLLGNPNVEAMTTDNSKLNLPTNIQNRIQEDSQIETASNLPSKYFEHDEKAIEKLSTAPDLTITTENPTKKQDLQAVELKVEQHSNLQIPHVTNQTHTSIQSDVLQEIRHGKYKIRVAPSDLVDFGGQRSFDMTHQLFIQHKGTFVLMFDGRYGLHSPLKEYPQGDITAKDILVHWVDSILIYCGEGDDKMPMILFAATHSDRLLLDQITAEKRNFTSELTTLFQNHSRKKHIIFDRIFFINATNSEDPEIELLKDALVDIAFQQPTWGQRMPMAWVPLELQISEMRTKGINLVTKETIQELNLSNPDFMLNEFRLDEFLKLQHSLGKIMYFDQPTLQDFVIIQPSAMVNILRSFVTDKIFLAGGPRTQKNFRGNG